MSQLQCLLFSKFSLDGEGLSILFVSGEWVLSGEGDSCQIVSAPSGMGFIQKGKNLLPMGANSFLLE